MEELRKALPDGAATPCFGMLRLTVGQGTFARQKTVLITYFPDSCPGIKKAKFASKKGEVRKAVGDVHTEWIVASADDFSVPKMMEAVKHIAADSTKGDFSIAKMTEDYEAMIKSSGKSAGAGGAVKIDLLAATGRKTAAEMGVAVPSNTALKAVREAMGPFNWALFAPSEPGKDLIFVNAGSLSVIGEGEGGKEREGARAPLASLCLCAAPHSSLPLSSLACAPPILVQSARSGSRRMRTTMASCAWALEWAASAGPSGSSSPSVGPRWAWSSAVKLLLPRPT